jgi:hypothetical protein
MHGKPAPLHSEPACQPAPAGLQNGVPQGLPLPPTPSKPPSPDFSAALEAALPEIKRRSRNWAYLIDYEDVLQEALTVAVQKSGEFDLERPLLPWVMGIVQWIAVKYLRREQVARRRFSHDVVDLIVKAYSSDRHEAVDIVGLLQDCLRKLQAGGADLDSLRKRYGLEVPAPPQVIPKPADSPGAEYQRHYRLINSLRDCVTRKIAANGTNPRNV